MCHVDITSKEWKKLPPEERKQFLARAIATHFPPDGTKTTDCFDLAKGSDSDEDSDTGDRNNAGHD